MWWWLPLVRMRLQQAPGSSALTEQGMREISQLPVGFCSQRVTGASRECLGGEQINPHNNMGGWVLPWDALNHPDKCWALKKTFSWWRNIKKDLAEFLFLKGEALIPEDKFFLGGQQSCSAPLLLWSQGSQTQSSQLWENLGTWTSTGKGFKVRRMAREAAETQMLMGSRKSHQELIWFFKVIPKGCQELPC